jgi:hypothetical protein
MPEPKEMNILEAIARIRSMMKEVSSGMVKGL